MNIKTVKRGGSRYYLIGDDERKAVGVTSVVGMLPKDFLKWWAAKMVAEFAVDNAPSWIGLVMAGERQAAIDILKRAHLRSLDNSAQIGTQAHEVFERLANGETLSTRDVHPDVRWAAERFRRWLAEFEPVFKATEATVFHEQLGYAGTFDAIADIEVDGTTSSVLLDWKTSRTGPHPEVALQLAAYRHATHLYVGGEVKPMVPTDHAGVLVVRPDRAEFRQVHATAEVFEVFKALLQVHQYEKDLKDQVLGDVLWSEVDGDEF